MVLLLYFRNKENKELTKFQIKALSVLRFLSVFTVSFLLLSPFIKTLKKITQKPIIIFAWDNSASVINTEDSINIKNQINILKTDLNEKLGADYHTINYQFGSAASQNEGMLTFTEKESDYGNLLNTISQNHYNQNIGALILVGDGIYNRGKNPVNLAEQIGFPVHAIAFGDTTTVLDARIEEILTNRTAFSGNKFKVEVSSQFSKLQSRSLKLSVIYDGKEIEAVIVTPLTNDFFYTHEFTLDALGKGLQHFTVKIEEVNGERNRLNNTSRFVINVLENKQKVLILSDGNHPDIGAIKNTLENQVTYDVSVFTHEPYPDDMGDFNLVILNQLPTASKSMGQVFEKLEQQKIPGLILVGSKTFIPQLNSVANYTEIKPLAGNAVEEAQAIYNPGFGTFSFSENVRENVGKFPPLQVPFANFEMDASFSTLFFQKIKNIETNKPLMVTGKFLGIKRGIIFGEGLCRWRLFDYLNSGSHARFNEIINQIIQYLALRENEDNFMINYQPVYSEIENVKFTAEVYNDVFEPVNTEEISMEISNEKDEKFNLIFDKGSSGYKLDAGNFTVGNYKFNAQVTLGDETFNESGEFAVMPVNMEQINSQANHQLLYLISQVSGGNYYQPNKKDDLLNYLKNNPLNSTYFFQEMVTELLNLKALFFVLLLLLSMEWFLRKYWGIY